MLQGDRINSYSRRCSKARSADLTPQSGNAAPSHPLTTNYSFIDFHLALDDAVPGEAFVNAFAGAGEKFCD